MATATFDFVPGETVWIINTVIEQTTGQTSKEVEKATVSQTTYTANVFQTKITYKVQLAKTFAFVDIDQLETTFPVVASTSGLNGTFSVVGDQTATLTAGTIFHIDNSQGNDGSYTVLTSTFGAGPNTVITVTGTVPVASGTGLLSVVPSRLVFPDVDSALAAYKLIVQ